MKKKLLFFVAIVIASAFAANADNVRLSCGVTVQTVSEDCLPPEQWEEFMQELEDHYCISDTDTEVQPDIP